MKGLVDEYFVCPRCTADNYFPWLEELVEKYQIDYAFVQPEAEIVKWADYYEKNGKYPCPVFMGDKLLSESLRDKSIMADLLKGTKFIPKQLKSHRIILGLKMLKKKLVFHVGFVQRKEQVALDLCV